MPFFPFGPQQQRHVGELWSQSLEAFLNPRNFRERLLRPRDDAKESRFHTGVESL